MSLPSRYLMLPLLVVHIGLSGTLACTAESGLLKKVPVATKQDPLAVGIALFNAKSYEQSVSYLRGAIKDNPKSGLGHYYLANALVHSGRSKEAKQQFFDAYCLEPNSTIGQYCRRALDVYGRSESNLAAAQRETKNFNKAVSVIHEQMEREKTRNGVTADSLSARDANQAEAEIAKIQTTTLHTVGTAPYVAPVGNLKRNVIGTTDATLAQAEENIRLERLAAKAKSEEYKRRSESQNKQAEDVAASLESQMKSTGIKGSAKLHPEGTGFYVRYYGRGGPGTTLPDVHQSVVRIVPVSTASAPSAEAPTVSPKSANNREPNQKMVRATVLGQ
jgi:hypothetical protein